MHNAELALAIYTASLGAFFRGDFGPALRGCCIAVRILFRRPAEERRGHSQG